MTTQIKAARVLQYAKTQSPTPSHFERMRIMSQSHAKRHNVGTRHHRMVAYRQQAFLPLRHTTDTRGIFMIFDLSKQLLQDFSQLLANVPKPQLEENQIKVIIESALQKFQLVTRSEFDAQTAVLARTRQKIEDLEKQLNELEARLSQPQ